MDFQSEKSFEKLRLRAFQPYHQTLCILKHVEDVEDDWVLLLLLPNVMEHRSLLIVFLLLPKSPRGPPWNEGHRPRVRHETSVFEVPAQEQHEHSFYSNSTNTFITCSLYTVRRYRTSPGAPDLRARLG